jgi:hypothetical protein
MKPSSSLISPMPTPSTFLFLILSTSCADLPSPPRLLELGVPTAQLSAYVPLIKTEDQGKVVA